MDKTGRRVLTHLHMDCPCACTTLFDILGQHGECGMANMARRKGIIIGVLLGFRSKNKRNRVEGNIRNSLVVYHIRHMWRSS